MSKEYSPEVVGQSFIKQYYEMFAGNPSELHRFYKDESSFSHAEGHQVISSVTSIEGIREHIGSLQLAGCRLDLSEGSIDAQKSEQGGVFLVVTGNLMMPGQPARQFVQSFFLAAQSTKGIASYYVRNSVFRLLAQVQEVSSSPVVEIEKTPDVIELPTPEIETVEYLAEQVEESQQLIQEEIQPNGGDQGLDHNTVASEPEYVNVSLRDNLESLNDEEEQQVPEEETDPSSVSARSIVQRSFAELVKGWGENSAPEVSQPVPQKKATKAPSDPVPTPAVSTVEKASPNPEVAPPSALYLNQLPEDVTSPDQLLPLFAPYGPIRKIDVHPKGYAFVNYLEEASVTRVLEIAATTPEVFSVGGKTIQVREKLNKPKNQGGKDKRSGDRFKKEGWKNRGHGEKGNQGDRKPVVRTKNETKPQTPKGAKK